MPIPFFGYIFCTPQYIHCSYNGIKYQAGNANICEPINIEIDGTYQRRLFGFNDKNLFKGNILIDGKETWNSDKLKVFSFNEDGKSSIMNNEFKALFYASNMMKDMTIMIWEENIIDLKSVWVISAPCTNREQALEITNRFTYKETKKLIE